jgi:hypothetical protein
MFLMFGKLFESLYSGSMVGAGAVRFAVWGFVIATQKPSRQYGSVVELNPRLLSAILGEAEKDVAEAIDFLCQPDPFSRSKEQDGRRLVRLGQFLFQVVNGAKYRAIRDEETRRTQNREAQRRFLAKKAGGGTSARERMAVEADGAGDDFEAGRAALHAGVTERDPDRLKLPASILPPEAGQTPAAPTAETGADAPAVEPGPVEAPKAENPPETTETGKTDAPGCPPASLTDAGRVRTAGNFTPSEPKAAPRPPSIFSQRRPGFPS